MVRQVEVAQLTAELQVVLVAPVALRVLRMWVD